MPLEVYVAKFLCVKGMSVHEKTILIDPILAARLESRVNACLYTCIVP